jgi:hypothetical protein
MYGTEFKIQTESHCGCLFFLGELKWSGFKAFVKVTGNLIGQQFMAP